MHVHVHVFFLNQDPTILDANGLKQNTKMQYGVLFAVTKLPATSYFGVSHKQLEHRILYQFQNHVNLMFCIYF